MYFFQACLPAPTAAAVVATLHGQPMPASFTALSLLHIPMPTAHPIMLRELLQQPPETTVIWAGSIDTLPHGGSGLRDICSNPYNPSTSAPHPNNPPPLHPPWFTPVTHIVAAYGRVAPSHCLALVTRALPIARKGLVPLGDGHPLQPLPLHRLPSALVPPVTSGKRVCDRSSGSKQAPVPSQPRSHRSQFKSPERSAGG